MIQIFKKYKIILYVFIFCISVIGCSHDSQYGVSDEFTIIVKPALIVPPDYHLLPPLKETNYKHKIKEENHYSILTGRKYQTSHKLSKSEQNLLSSAGALDVPSKIRQEVDNALLKNKK